jgi:hypothetical protein
MADALPPSRPPQYRQTPEPKQLAQRFAAVSLAVCTTALNTPAPAQVAHLPVPRQFSQMF